MSRLTRNAVILAKVETTYGTNASPTGAANAILVGNISATPLASKNVNRDIIRPYLGGAEQLVGTKSVELSFDVELQSSGVVATAPAFGPLLRACGFAQTVNSAISVEYTPVSTGFESLTINYHDDGVLHQLLGARGDVSFKMGIGDRPVMSFKFIGLYGGITAAVNPTGTYTAFKTPKVVTDSNSGGLLLGCTYSSSTLSGGTAYSSRGLEIAIGNKVGFLPLLGNETVNLSNRDAFCKLTLDLTATEEAAFMDSVIANTTQSMGFLHGSAAGYITTIYAPSVQLINPSKADVDGIRLIGFDGRIMPSSGNDDIVICFK